MNVLCSRLKSLNFEVCYKARRGRRRPFLHIVQTSFNIAYMSVYRIKPVFVFDGAPPQLKKDTLNRRRMKRSKESKAAKVASEKILSNYIQRQAVSQRLNRQTHAVQNALKGGTSVGCKFVNM